MEQTNDSVNQTAPVIKAPVPENSGHLHSFAETEKANRKDGMKTIVIIAVVVALGTLTGYLLSNVKATGGLPSANKNAMINTEKVVGTADTTNFKDKAEGKLEKGGIDGEGSHKLVRDPKRPDQTVYLTSSVVDLDQFVGKKVRVWGQTYTAQKAGWLMDVGKVEIL